MSGEQAQRNGTAGQSQRNGTTGQSQSRQSGRPRKDGKPRPTTQAWQALAGDARRWAAAHRFAVGATLAFVAVNLVAWIAAAVTGFDFPLRLHTSMAEFSLGKLLCSLFLARGVIQLVFDALLWLVMLSIAERWLGRARTVRIAVACALGGVIVGLTLCAATGSLLHDARIVERISFVLSPLTLPVGALMAASAYCTHLWRQRIRLIGYVAILVTLLYSGNPGGYCILAAAIIGHVAGAVMRQRERRLRAFDAGTGATRVAGTDGFDATDATDATAETESAETRWHWLRGTSYEIRRLYAAIAVVLALGPVLAITAHTHAGPLSTLGLIMSPAAADDGTLARCVAGSTRTDCFLQFDLLRTSMPGAVLRSLLPTAVTLVLAWGLYRGRRFAAVLSVAVNLVTAGVAVAYYLVVPLRFAPDGVDSLVDHGAFAACVANALPPFAFAVALLVGLRRFPVRVGWRRLAGGAAACVLALLACTAVYLLYGLALPGEFAPRATAAALLAELPGRFLPIGFLSHVRLAFVPVTLLASIVYQGVGLVFWIVVLVVVVRWMGDVTAVDERARARAERLVEAGGESMSFMTTWEGNEYWMSDSGRSAVAYRVWGGVALTCTGPFGDPSEWDDDLIAFSKYCASRSLTPAFYAVHRGQRDRLLAMGWQSIEVGGEMVVDPRQWKTTGKKWQDIRTAINKAKRQGVVDVYSTFLDAPLDVREQIEDISEEWAQGKALPEMKFTLGGVEELRDPRVRLLYAMDADGRVLGVTSWLPTWRDGRIVGWTLDFMRHRPDSPNGVMEFLIARMAERLRDEGASAGVSAGAGAGSAGAGSVAGTGSAVEFMSLSAAPLAGMNPERDNTLPGGGDGVDAGTGAGADGAGEAGAGRMDPGIEVLQHALQLVADWMEPAYGFHSLFNFKRKFQPSEEPVYVCYPDAAKLAQIGLAVTHAYVPSVTPGEIAGMLRTLRK
ncbi:bifunctional lysylphosphatidylglycerol flippase/synthetase MprF [Bifidobacterium parmae]|uniref:Phosphatidylglycerol lysyltransferase C-terminal domain-containing protein n=1 Tax=Bifidobacterium parmae TaxID=361854 RepID=A0A2N5J4U8_9BIFI|nr:phosphatidylglycerol lysyltransferase domain-containing protein [Bifidobacterium parmae]PLS29228.1 hypothetical protein Uis4E_0648 [Bifidobacterium parmae]